MPPALAAALAAARRPPGEPGFLLSGEARGGRENPPVIRSLMRAFGLSGLALEWHEDLAPAAGAFLAAESRPATGCGGPGDGRITAGRLAVLRERAGARPLSLTLSQGTIGADGTIGAGWDWSQRDEAMARRILDVPAAGEALVPQRPLPWPESPYLG